MADPEDILELQKLEEESEIAAKKLEQAKNRLRCIQKQCNESKIEIEKVKSELETLNSTEQSLNRIISKKSEKEAHLVAECEKMAKKMQELVWRRKIQAAKLEWENHNRQRYVQLMNTTIEPASFLQIHEYQENSKKVEELRNKLEVLQKEVLEKQNLYAEREKLKLETRKSYEKSLETLEGTKKSIANVGILIHQQEEELQKLLDDEGSQS